jgi:transcriptional regulator GlxA family with amidase domain
MATGSDSARRLRGQGERTRRVAMLAYPQAQILDITGPLEVFARTSRWLADHTGRRVPAYAVELVAARRGPLVTSGGLRLIATRAYRELGPVDTLLVAGGIGFEAALADPDLLAFLRARARAVRRIGSICNGAMVLAGAGLLDGRSATTHWSYCDRLARCAPRTRVEPDALYVQSGRVYTSAGVTAGMDMALAMVEQDWGKATALAVARELVMFVKRPGGQSQFSHFLEAQQRDDRFGDLELWILEHLDADLSVENLARRCSMSERHFARLFTARIGRSPARHVARLRIDAARRRIEEGASRLKDVARECGFGDEQRLRRAFRRSLGVTPLEYRQRFA